MSKSTIKWVVMPKPTGRYRSFEKRGWPWGEDRATGRVIFFIECPDDYTNGKPPHGPLTLYFKSGSKRYKVKSTFENMDLLKRYAEYLKTSLGL